MATRKVTITLPEEIVERLNAVAAADGVPMSRVVARAAEAHLRQRLALQVIEEWIAENGDFTPEEVAHVDAVMAAAESAMMRRMSGDDSPASVP